MKNMLCFLVLVLSTKFSMGQECEPQTVINSMESPNKYVCYIQKFNKRGKPFTTTGFLIGPRILLTNAHNVYNAKRYKISAGHNGQGVGLDESNQQLPFGVIQVDRSKSNTFFSENFIWREKKRRRKKVLHYDYAIIVLPDSSLYKKLGGFLELVEADSIIKVADSISFIGYPGGIVDYNLQLNQKTNTGVVNGYYEDIRMISYRLGTRRGASGSPILKKFKSKYVVIGIHGYGTGCENSAIKIDREVLETIEKWKNAAGIF